MASRSELRQICEELHIDDTGLNIDEMTEKIKEVFDKKYENPKHDISADQFSKTLLKFMTLEYDYIIEDKEGNELDYNLEKK